MSALSNILPLLILLIVLAVLTIIGFIVWSVMQEVKSNTAEKMNKHNVVFSKDGMKVGVKEVKAEDYADRTQSVLVNAWNSASLPNYKSRFWNQEAEINQKSSRMPFARSSSSSRVMKRAQSDNMVPKTSTTTSASPSTDPSSTLHRMHTKS